MDSKRDHENQRKRCDVEQKLSGKVKEKEIMARKTGTQKCGKLWIRARNPQAREGRTLVKHSATDGHSDIG